VNIGRRDMLKVIGAATLVVGGAPLIHACRGLVRDDLGAGDSDSVAGPALDPQVRDILYHASLAPSGHNAQPWTVRRLEPGRLVIGSAEERWLPAVDPTNRELLLSIGAFLGNLIIAARHHGYDAEYRVLGTTGEDRDILEVRLFRASALAYPLEKIRLRRTVRGGHLPTPLKADDVRALSEPFESHLAFFPRGSPAAKYLETATVEANRIQADRDAAQDELSRWIRFTDDEGRRYRNGLTPESMEITGLSGWFVRHFMDRPSVMKQSFRARGVEAARKQVQAYGGWLVVTSPNSSVATLIETGRRFQSTLLHIRERMIAIHPMTQVLEEAPFRDQVARELDVSGVVQFILRVSYLKRYPDPVSLRMPVSWFVLS